LFQHNMSTTDETTGDTDVRHPSSGASGAGATAGGGGDGGSSSDSSDEGALHDFVTAFIRVDQLNGRTHRVIDRRVLRDVSDVVQWKDPSKLLITTLAEVFEAFWAVAAAANSPSTPGLWVAAKGPLPPVFFEYEGRMWRGTVLGQPASQYGSAKSSKQVHFINVKLPNDSFLYIDARFGTTRRGLEVGDLDTQRLMHTLYDRISVLFEQKALSLGPPVTSYNRREERVFVRFWDTTKSFCVAIEWENGFPVEYMDKEVRARGEEWARNLIAYAKERRGGGGGGGGGGGDGGGDGGGGGEHNTS
jgi:hypothetical protein